MIKKYTVKMTDEAIKDMEDIYNYISEELLSPQNALGQYNRIAEAILTLDEFPDRFGIFQSEPEHSWGMHKMVVDNYLVCYVIDDTFVTVTDVLYGASDIHNKLNERH